MRLARRVMATGLFVTVIAFLVWWLASEKTKWSYTVSIPIADVNDCSASLKDGRVAVAGYTISKYSLQTPLQFFDPKTNSWTVQFLGLLPTLNSPPKELPLYQTSFIFERFFPWKKGGAGHGLLTSTTIPDDVFLANDAARIREPMVLTGGQTVVFSQDQMTGDNNGHFLLKIKDTLKSIEKPSGPLGSIFNVLSLHDGRFIICRSYSHSFWPIREEIYDPKTDRWQILTDHYKALGQSATLLPDGKILFIGGAINVGEGFILSTFDEMRYWFTTTFFTGPHFPTVRPPTYQLSATCRIYDPVTNTWRLTDHLNIPRAFHTANLLPDGRVLVTGGYTKPEDGALTNSCETISLKDLEP